MSVRESLDQIAHCCLYHEALGMLPSEVVQILHPLGEPSLAQMLHGLPERELVLELLCEAERLAEREGLLNDKERFRIAYRQLAMTWHPRWQDMTS